MISCRRGKISRIVYFKPMRYIHAANLLYYTYIFMALFFSILRSNLITKPRKTPMRMVWITSHKKTSDRSLRKIPLTQCLKKEKSVTNLQHQRNQKRGSFFLRIFSFVENKDFATNPIFFHPNFLNHKNDYNLVFFLSFRKKESISRSSSSASSASEKPKQYKDSDSDNSSSEDEVKIKPKKKKKSKKSHKEKESKRKVYVKEDNDRDDRDRDRGDRDREDQGAKPKSRDDSFFGVTYIPPAGFCEECDVR